MKLILSLVLLVMTLAIPAAAHAYDVIMMPISGVNLAPGQTQAVTALFGQQYAAESGRSVGPIAFPANSDGKALDYAAVARDAGATEYLQGTCVALEDKYVLTVERHSQNGQLIYVAAMTANTFDDMPEVTKRLARSLLTRTPPADTITADTVTRNEAEAANRSGVVVSRGVKASITMPFASDASYEPIAGLAFNMKFELSRAFLAWGIGLMLPGSTGQDRTAYGSGFSEISGNYYLADGSFAPYVGGGVSPRLQMSGEGDDMGVGFAPFLQLGATFPRESRAHFLLEARLAQNLLPVGAYTESVYAVDGYNEKKHDGKYPTELSLQMAIVW